MEKPGINFAKPTTKKNWIIVADLWQNVITKDSRYPVVNSTSIEFCSVLGFPSTSRPDWGLWEQEEERERMCCLNWMASSNIILTYPIVRVVKWVTCQDCLWGTQSKHRLLDGFE